MPSGGCPGEGLSGDPTPAASHCVSSGLSGSGRRILRLPTEPEAGMPIKSEMHQTRSLAGGVGALTRWGDECLCRTRRTLGRFKPGNQPETASSTWLIRGKKSSFSLIITLPHVFLLEREVGRKETCAIIISMNKQLWARLEELPGEGRGKCRPRARVAQAHGLPLSAVAVPTTAVTESSKPATCVKDRRSGGMALLHWMPRRVRQGLCLRAHVALVPTRSHSFHEWLPACACPQTHQQSRSLRPELALPREALRPQARRMLFNFGLSGNHSLFHLSPQLLLKY